MCHRNNTHNVSLTTTVKSDIMSATGDDGRILVKIVDLVFVPISTTLTREMSGDSNNHGILMYFLSFVNWMDEDVNFVYRSMRIVLRNRQKLETG
jgi:hypothetical protein